MTIRSRRRRTATALAAILGAIGPPTASHAAPAQAPAVANIRQLAVTPAPPGERLTIALDRAATPVATREAPDLLAIELDLARPAYGVHGAVFANGLVAELRLVAVGVPSRPRTRLEIRTRGAAAHRVRVEPGRLLVDLVPAALAEALVEPPPTPVVRPVDPPPSAPRPAAPAPAALVELPAPSAVEPTPVAPPPAARIEEEDLDAARDEPIDEAPSEPAREVQSPAAAPPALAPAALPTVEPAPPAAIAPVPRPASPPLRDAIDAEVVPPLDEAARGGELDALAPAAPEGGSAPIRIVPIVMPEPVAPLAFDGDGAGLATVEAAPVPGTTPRLRDAIVDEPVAPLAAPAAARPTMAPSPPAAAPPLRVEVVPPPAAPAALADEVARPEELVPPAEIARPPATAPVAPAPAGPATRVMAIEQIDAGTVRIVADGTLAYLTFRLENPDRFVLELDGVVDESPRDSLPIGESVLLRVRVGQYRQAPRPVTRVVFDLRAPSVPEIESTPNGLVVRFVRALPKSSGVP
jgi:hypothetical protein